jgi:prepilin-type N-terminal cleavage/methylation domain-containing protein
LGGQKVNTIKPNTINTNAINCNIFNLIGAKAMNNNCLDEAAVTSRAKKRAPQSGFTIVELLVALVVVMAVIFIYGLNSANYTNNQSTILRLATMHHVGVSKAEQLAEPTSLERAISGLNATTTTLGSLAPVNAVANFSDELDLNGQIVPSGKGTFIRQWMIVNNKPTEGSQAIFVSVYERYRSDSLRYFYIVRGERKAQALESFDQIKLEQLQKMEQ